MDHRIEELQALNFIGIGVDCPGGDTSGIGPLWGQFYARVSEVEPTLAIWGASWCNGGEGAAAGFYYLAAHEVPQGTPAPGGMESHVFPASRYFAWSFKGTSSQMSAAFQDAFTHGIPEAGLKQAPSGACLERYQPDCWDEATGELSCELYVAVE